jgi:hypothetical protein
MLTPFVIFFILCMIHVARFLESIEKTVNVINNREDEFVIPQRDLTRAYLMNANEAVLEILQRETLRRKSTSKDEDVNWMKEGF